MKRQVIQIILLASLLGGALSQALACVSLQSDPHSCCRALHTSQPSKARLAARANQKSTTLPPCCAVAVPISPQQATVNNRDPQPTGSTPIVADGNPQNNHIVKRALKPKSCGAPSGYSPPSFILHHALLI